MGIASKHFVLRRRAEGRGQVRCQDSGGVHRTPKTGDARATNLHQVARYFAASRRAEKRRPFEAQGKQDAGATIAISVFRWLGMERGDRFCDRLGWRIS